MRSMVFLISLVLFAGCLCDPETTRYPDLFHPGHISEQQQRAKQFDPFTRSESGPKIIGDRPSGALDPSPAARQQTSLSQ